MVAMVKAVGLGGRTILALNRLRRSELRSKWMTAMETTDRKHALYYSDQLVENLQLRWGNGFMSPGGAAELARMLRDIDVWGREGLDFGCGVGGYDRLLVREHGASVVCGVDLGAAVIAEALASAQAQGLADRLRYLVVESGALPFEDASFGFVFSKDAIVEVPDRDKPEVLRELYRVTEPGGWAILGDWFRGPDEYTREMREWATSGGEVYEMVTIAEAAEWLRKAGYTDVSFEDRNVWYRTFARDEYERLGGALRSEYVDRFGEAYAAKALENARVRALLADQGQLRPGHVRGRRPL
jgi:SAM-dependent methyltransferase